MSATDALGSSLTPEERLLVGHADQLGEEAIALLERAVNIDGATEDLEGVRRVGALFGADLEALGFAVRWEEMPSDMHRAGHLVAERSGTLGERLLLIGHLDTVLAGGRFRRDGSRATGAGVVDIKGGDVVLIAALKALHRCGRLDDRGIIVVLTGDEEDAGLPLETSRATLQDAARRSDVALAFEPLMDGTATVARRGVSSWTLRVAGRTGHASQIFGAALGSGAIFEAARILDAFHRELAGEEGLSLNASLVLGGTEVATDAGGTRGAASGKRNVVPQAAVVEGEFRFLSGRQAQDAEARMRAIVARHLPATTAEFRVAGEYPAMAPEPGNYELLALYDRASRDLGLGAVAPLPPSLRGAGDISFVSPPLPGLDGLGALGGGEHTPDEWIDLDALAPQIRRVALLMARLTGP